MKHHKLSATAALLGSLIITSSLACTDFRLKANDGTILVTRTMEFAIRNTVIFISTA
ncbi:MAG: hypothetical protein NTU49_10425 [Gammaproteobacteria bacterium]|nr:hypothetical protein [Gammaproteobacteria bacterium]